MTDSARAGRALSFGGVAEDYDHYRPAPPREALDWVLPDGAADVLDLGAGTGALTRVLLEWVPRHTGRVAAAEPDSRMRAVLARRSPEALVVGARAEALPFASASFDAVVVASAWHWMDPDRTVPEVARVLRPGGRLGVLWNGPVRTVPWVGALLRPADEESRHRRRHHLELPPRSPFTALEGRDVHWEIPMTHDELVGLAGTYSSVITQSPADRADLLERVAAVASAQVRTAGTATVIMPMACRSWRADLV
jgi:SAM-dependent methyltransferase